MSRLKGILAPARKRTCQEFLDEWQPRVRRSLDDKIELDFSWKDNAITITDMRIPSALRTGVLYTCAEVEAEEDRTSGDMNRRVERFMAQAVGLK